MNPITEIHKRPTRGHRKLAADLNSHDFNGEVMKSPMLHRRQIKVLHLLRQISFLILLPLNALWSQSTQTKRIDVGGYVLSLGMTTDQLIRGIGASFKYQFNQTENTFIFRNSTDEPLANVSVSNGRVTYIQKIYADGTGNSLPALAKQAYRDFLDVRTTSACKLVLDEQDTAISDLKIIDLVTACGNALFVFRTFFGPKGAEQTTYYVSILQK